MEALAVISMGAFALAGCATGTEDATIAGSVDGNAFDPGTGEDSGSSFDAGPSDSSHSKDTSLPDHSAPEVSVHDSSPADTGKPESAPETGAESSVTCASSGYTGTLATFTLTGEPGDETSVAATSTASSITGGALSRATTLTAIAGKDSINGSDWGTGVTADSTRFYTFIVTPASGCAVTLTSLALDVQASATGPTTGDVATSADDFATHTTSFAGTSSGAIALTASGSGALEIRVYGYGSSGSGGTLRIQNTMTVSGAIH